MEILVSVFGSCKAVIASGVIHLIEWLKGEGQYRKVVDKIRLSTNKEEISALKSILPAVTISGKFKERNLNGLIKHTGLMAIDIDGKDNPDITNIESLKDRISTKKYILYCGLSVSGRGLFCIVKISNPQKHLEHFFALEKEFADMGVVVDSACKDITRLRFFSYDDNAYYNATASVFDQCIEKSSEKSISVKSDRKKTEQQKRHPIKIKNNEEIDFMELAMKSTFESSRFFLSPTATCRQRAIYLLMERVMGKKIDITEEYGDWIFVCSIIAMNFGEDGRNLFHDISQYYPNYDEYECDHKYDEMLTKKYTPSIKTLELLMDKYGL